MKKIFILLSVLCMTMLTGCVDIDLTLDIEKNGSSKLVLELQGESYIMNEIDKSELESQYDKVEVIPEGSKIKYVLTQNIDKDMNTDNEAVNDSVDEYLDITKKGGLFTNTYTVNARLKDAMYSNMTSEEKSMMSFVGNSVPFKLHLKSPFKLEETNATSVEEVDGKTVYNWDYTLGNMDNISITAKLPNFIGIIGFVAVLAIAIVVFIKFRKNKQAK